MANENRKMATMRRVSGITPIDGADSIEAVHVDGWVVADRKNVWKPGELCVFYEVDSFLPTDDERYGFLAQFGEREMCVDGVLRKGHVLRTRRMLRKIWSQGLLMKPRDALPGIPDVEYEVMYEHGTRLDPLVGVCEYVPVPTPGMGSNFIGKYNDFVAPKTDALRIENIGNSTFEKVAASDHFVSVKVDGTSITMCLDPRVNRMRVFSHHNEFDTDKPGIGMTAINCAREQGVWAWCESNPGKTVQCELAGPKLQSNRLRLARHRLFVFSVWDMEEETYLNPYDIPPLRPSCAPLYNIDLPSFVGHKDELSAHVDGLRGMVTDGCPDEGIVIHVMGQGGLSDGDWDTLRLCLTRTMQVKVVSRGYLARQK